MKIDSFDFLKEDYHKSLQLVSKGEKKKSRVLWRILTQNESNLNNNQRNQRD